MTTRERWLKRGQWIAGGLALIALGALLAALPIRAWIEGLRAVVDSLGAWGPPIYALLYAVACVCLLPSGPFQFGAGLLFGLGIGIPTALAGTWLALTGAFIVGRWLARERVQSMLEGRPRMQAVESAIADGGWKTVIMLRLSPILPMSLHNYVYGLTRIPMRVYVPSAALAVTPGTVMWAWIGAASASAATIDSDASTVKWILRGVGLVATIAVSVILARKAKASLDEKRDDEAGGDEANDGSTTGEAPPRWRVAALSAAAATLTVGAVLSHIYSDVVERALGG